MIGRAKLLPSRFLLRLLPTRLRSLALLVWKPHRPSSELALRLLSLVAGDEIGVSVTELGPFCQNVRSSVTTPCRKAQLRQYFSVPRCR